MDLAANRPVNPTRRAFRLTLCGLLTATLALGASGAIAGAQVEELLAPSVATLMSRAISDTPVPALYAASPAVRAWVAAMSTRLVSRFPDARDRADFLATVHYEAIRAGLEPELMLAVIQHESGFRKYAVSTAGARGFMQVMPFWVKLIGADSHNLFHLRTNLRYGAVILRHYLDIESGDLFRALGRYNGSLGRPEYPEAVLANLARHWRYAGPAASAATLGVVAAPVASR